MEKIVFVMFGMMVFGVNAASADVRTKCYRTLDGYWSIEEKIKQVEAKIQKVVQSTIKDGYTQINAVTPIVVNKETTSICVTATRP